MKNFNDLNDTSKYLSHFIFKPGSMTSLLSFGLENVYIDDYNHRCKYEDCLLFLIKNGTSNEFLNFQSKITSFQSFYDYYPVYTNNLSESSHTMYVYQIAESLIPDYNFFKEKKFNELTHTFWQSIGARIPLNFSHVKFDLHKEIYNFDKTLILNTQSEQINK